MSNTLEPSPDHHYHFVTGRLAQSALQAVVQPLSQQLGFTYSIGVMPITVAALMTPKWLLRHLEVPQNATHLVLPGYLTAGADQIAETVSIPVICGPKDCRQIPEWLGQESTDPPLEQHAIEIIAEINHCPRYRLDDLVQEAEMLREAGADVIDLGCDPGSRCADIHQRARLLTEAGFRVSIDTFDPWEAQQAVSGGASLVLSVNASNRSAAPDWGCEVVVVPDSPDDEKSFSETIEFLSVRDVPMRLDPILEPIGTGFAQSVVRYASTRNRYPDTPMMMGIGNLTELTDVDSAGVNFLLLGICAELRVGSVLTTQVINWARSSVRECDVARRLVHHAVNNGVPPKRLSDQLVMLRDPKLRPFPKEALQSLSQSLTDNNYRLYAQDDQIHLISAGMHLSDDDPFRLFDALLDRSESRNVDAGHAFYLGFEMAKASIALTLNKQYEQDQALRWGILTQHEDYHRIARTSRHRTTQDRSQRRGK